VIAGGPAGVARTRSADETRALGRRLAGLLRAGDVVALTGQLGAGKTCLVQGIADGLGVGREEEVRSPTFTLVHEYRGRLPLYHLDLYRLADPEGVRDLGWEEALGGAGVVVIEWSERAGAWIPSDRLDVALAWRGETEREVRVVPHGRSWMGRLDSLRRLENGTEEGRP
jgi:tRNA threonylcarbamoyladenosine biosynthesis protein TsaE